MENRMLSDEILLALIKKNSGGGQSGIHVKGVTTTALTDGCDTNPITINGESYTAVDGDLVAYQSKEFLFNGTIWQELGDVSEVMAIIEKILDDIADEFDATTTYAVDDFVVKDSVLYKCISAHTGAWDANDFITTTVADEIASKQNTLAVGKYIDITNGKISVDRVIPNETFKYVLQQIENYTIKVTKSVNNIVVSEEIYGPPADWDTPVAVTLDEAIYLYIHLTGTVYYDLLIASDTHDAGYHQQMLWYGRDTYTENFSTVDHTGEKLIIKSEMDTALSDKQGALTAGKYINIDANNEISVDPVVPNEAFTYRIYGNNGHHTVEKIVDGVVVHRENHESGEFNPPIIYDDAIKITYYNAGSMKYELLIPSDTHEVGYVQTWAWWNNIDFTETFSTVDHTGEKLITKSDMDAALADKQNALTAGKYINIDANNEITVNREIPNVSASYELKTTSTSDPEINTDVIKRMNGEIVWQENYNYQTVRDNPVTIDDVFVLSYSGQWKYKLLVASDDHAAGYEQTWGWSAWVDYTENFSLVDNTGKKLVIKSEMDTALAGKQGALTAGDYIKFDGNEISVKRLVLDGDEYTYDIYSKSTQTHVVVDKYNSNSTLVSTREYYMNDMNPAVAVDGLFTLYLYGGPWTCTLLVASKDHAAGYSFSSQLNNYTHHSETFELPPEESQNDLIIRSELDTALAGKQDVLTAGNYVSITNNGTINVTKSIGVYDVYSYELMSTGVGITIQLTKKINNVTISTQDIGNQDYSPENKLIVDGLFELWYDLNNFYWHYKLIVDSNEHQKYEDINWYYTTMADYTETFNVSQDSSTDLVTRSELDAVSEKLPAVPSTDGTYILTATVTNGEVVYSWESNNGLTQEQINALIALLD